MSELTFTITASWSTTARLNFFLFMFSCYHIILYSGLIDEWEWVCHSNHETECLLLSEQLYKAQYSEQKNTVQCAYENNPEKYPSGYGVYIYQLCAQPDMKPKKTKREKMGTYAPAKCSCTNLWGLKVTTDIKLE